MKGHTKIELTNVETGDTEVYEDDNLFTDIFGELVNDNNFGFTAISTDPGMFLPLSTAALGGIALFSEAQTASASNMYPTKAAMAYAGNNTDAGSNVYKGTYNVTESGAITNGYKHVWDFTTSQGNGEIASVSLVHPYCGNNWPASSIHTIKTIGSGSEDSFIGACKLINQSAQLFIGYDRASEHIQVRRIETIIDSLSSVNARLYSDSCPYTVEKDIVINNDTNKNHASNGMVWRVDGTNAIGYGHAGNSSGDAYIYVITVDINTLDYTESSITIANTAIQSFGYGVRYAITRNGYLYCRRHSDRKLLKINLSNTTDITEINDTNSYLGYDEVLDYVILSSSSFLYPDDTIGSGGEFPIDGWYNPYVPIMKIGTKQLVVANRSGANTYRIITPRIYLGTINNLDSPVVKTASQTMKITYTITDSTEVVLRGISVTHVPNTTRFAKGTALDTTGLEVTAAYSGNTTEVVTNSCVLSPANGSTLTDTSVTSIGISFRDGDITRTTSTPITVYSVSQLSVTTQPTQTVYSVGDTLDLTGLVLTATTSDGQTEVVTSSCTFSPANGSTLTLGTTAVTATYTLGSSTVTASIPITVQAATLSSIAVTTMPTQTTYYVGDVLDLTGIVVTATYSDSSTAVVTGGCTFSPADGDTLSTAGTQSVTVSYTAGTVTKTTSFNVSIASGAPIYGATWDGSSSTTWTRTDAASAFTDPNPYYAGMSGTPSSPFDTISPWKDMVRVTDSECGETVRIPKFYVKVGKSGSSMSVQISMSQHDGFSPAPIFQDTGDGRGELDYILVGRYHCASDFKSKTGVIPHTNITRAAFRTGIHNLGTDVYQWDYAVRLTLFYLYIVEFADWNSQAKIGYGCGNDNNAQAQGATDSMPYHTGTAAASRTTYAVGVQYRHIEGLWDNVIDFIDGIYFSGANVYIIKNPDNFSDSANGTLIGTRSTAAGYISAWFVSSADGYEEFIYPSAAGGSESTYVCDYCYYDASGVVLVAGGNHGHDPRRGLFYLGGNDRASDAYGGVGSRCMKKPSAA